MAKRTTKSAGRARSPAAVAVLPTPALEPFDRGLRTLALIGIYAALSAPVILFKSCTADPYSFFKALFLHAVLALTFPAYPVLAWRHPSLRPKRSPIARAFWLQKDLPGLRSMQTRLAGLPPDDAPAGMALLAIADYQEQAGLIPERDAMARLARDRDPRVTERLQPFLDGRVPTITQAERLTAP